jgi:RNA polymerase sigma factor (TIGR02999 family)
MGETAPGHVTQLLGEARAGRREAAAELMELVYEELRALAHRQMADVPASDTLQPTALVHEAYLRLVGRDAPIEWESRAHFFNAAARAMRDIIVDQARKHAGRKRGGDRLRVTLDEQAIAPARQSEDLLALDEALGELEQIDRDGAGIVMLRYFAGLSIEDTAQALGMPPATLKRRWRYARAWLRRRLNGQESTHGS